MASKLQITLSEGLLEKVDGYVHNHYMTRSGLIAVALDEYLSSREALSAMKNMAATLENIARQGSVDDQSLRELELYKEMFARVAGVR